MRIAVAGGGPAGLYFSILMRRVAPDCEIVVFERNRAEDAFGFGVVFSDETLTVFEHADPLSYRQITDGFVHWTDIDIHHRGHKTRSGGHGFSALGRKELLGILQHRAASLGAEIRFCAEAPPVDELAADFDLVVGADGASSAVRAARAERLRAHARSPPLPLHVDGHRPGVRRVQVLHRRDRRTACSRPTPIPTAAR